MKSEISRLYMDFERKDINTPFFTLKAPKVRIKDTENRYKI